MWTHFHNVISSVLVITHQSMQWHQIQPWIKIEIISKKVNTSLPFSSKGRSTVNINNNDDAKIYLNFYK